MLNKTGDSMPPWRIPLFTAQTSDKHNALSEQSILVRNKM